MTVDPTCKFCSGIIPPNRSVVRLPVATDVDAATVRVETYHAVCVPEETDLVVVGAVVPEHAVSIAAKVLTDHGFGDTELGTVEPGDDGTYAVRYMIWDPEEYR